MKSDELRHRCLATRGWTGVVAAMVRATDRLSVDERLEVKFSEALLGPVAAKYFQEESAGLAEMTTRQRTE